MRAVGAEAHHGFRGRHMYITQQVAVAKDGRILAAYAVDAKALPEHEYTKVAAQFSRPVSMAGNFDILVLFEGDGGVVAHREIEDITPGNFFSVHSEYAEYDLLYETHRSFLFLFLPPTLAYIYTDSPFLKQAINSLLVSDGSKSLFKTFFVLTMSHLRSGFTN
jgi:hypothetical protein